MICVCVYRILRGRIVELKNMCMFDGFFFQFVFIFGCCWVFVAVHGLSLVVVRGLLIAVASLVAEHRLQGTWAQ